MTPSSPPSLRDRTSGILLHLTSLPGPHGNGDLGADARSFVDFLAAAGQRWWQMLPVGPAGYGDSPYSAQSAFAGSPLLIALEPLRELGVVLDQARLPNGNVDYESAAAFRNRHLRRALENMRRRPASERVAFEEFCAREARWLDDFALFAALKRAHGGVEWTRWQDDYRMRRPAALERARREHADEIEQCKLEQYLFARQWSELRAYAAARGVGLIGDIPIFVAHDSADVWQHRELFQLDEGGAPTVVAGVPPDYFSATGQRWGNPLYRWGRLKKSGFSWWVDRFHAALERFDAIRLDHFIGFVRYWKIPANEPTAMNGRWMKGPGRDLFEAVRREHGDLPLIAEDLGAVTPKVHRLRRTLGLPGIRLLQFAFGDDPQAPSFLPYNHERNAVVYTGTHDNDTVVGWYSDRGGGPDSTRTAEQARAERARVRAYLGRDDAGDSLEDAGALAWDMIRLAMSSVARTVIVPMQDVLGLGSEARMNRPGNPTGNWRWRLEAGRLDPTLAARLLAMSRTYGRTR